MDVLTAPTARGRASALFAAIFAGGALIGIGGAWAKGALAQAEISACLDRVAEVL